MRWILPGVIATLLVANSLWQMRIETLNRRVLGAQIERDQKIKRLSELRSRWEKIASESPTFRDAYVQLSALNARLGSTQEAKMYLEKAIEIDPNWEAPAELAPLLR